MAEPFLCEMRLFSFVFAPRGWALSNGQLLPINQNQALFALLGTTFGGDGRVNFALPDLRSRVPLHVGSGHTLGERGGAMAHTLSLAEMGAHRHPVAATSAVADLSSPTGARWARTSEAQYGDGGTVAMAGNLISNTRGGQAHLNMQPYLTLSFCIALQGIFPSPT